MTKKLSQRRRTRRKNSRKTAYGLKSQQIRRNNKMPEAGLIDIHCHIIPGVDDGAESFEEAVQMLRMEYTQGVRKIIATPHYRKQYFETSAEKIKRQFGLLKKATAAAGIDI